MSLIGLLIFTLALIGYAGMLRMLGVNKYLAWISAMICQTLILYVFSMLSMLRLGIKVSIGLGLIFCLVRLILLFFRIGRLDFEGIHYFDIWMAALGIMVGKVLYASPLIHYDNYSHWALIVKFLFYQGHLPLAHDALISFTSYPPATALFITQFVSMVGFSAGAMLVGQFLLIWAAFYSVFAVLRDRARALNSFILCLIISLTNVFNIAIRMNNLLVDFVLPVITVAGIAGVYVYRKRPWLQCSHVFLFSSELLLIKNSGSFFMAMIGGFLIYQLTRNGRGARFWRISRSLILSAVTLGLAYLPFYWWQQHVHATFSGVSKHEISTQAYKSQLAHESTHVILKIGQKMLHQILSFNSLSTQGILLINVGLLVAWLLIRYLCQQHNNLLKVLVTLDLVFIAYYISLFAMYVVSMPYAEAILLDGFERYMSSMVVLNLLLGTMALVVAMDKAFHKQRIERRNLRSFSTIFTKNLYQLSALTLMIFSVIMMFSEINGIQYNNSIGQNQLPVQMQRIAHQRTHYNHDKVLVVDPHANDVNNYYAGYVGRYYFFSDKVVGQENFMMSPKAFKLALEKYQYVAIPEWHRTFTVMAQKVYHQHLKTGLFKVTPNRLVRVH